jgi:hypothetical protein
VMDGSRLASLPRQRGALLRQSVLDGRGQAQHWFLGLDQHIALRSSRTFLVGSRHFPAPQNDLCCG